MPFTDEDKHFIKILRKGKRYSSRKFIREFPNKNWSRRGLDHLIKKIDESDSTARKSGSGRPRTARHDDEGAEAAGPHYHHGRDSAVA